MDLLRVDEEVRICSFWCDWPVLCPSGRKVARLLPHVALRYCGCAEAIVQAGGSNGGVHGRDPANGRSQAFPLAISICAVAIEHAGESTQEKDPVEVY